MPRRPIGCERLACVPAGDLGFGWRRRLSHCTPRRLAAGFDLRDRLSQQFLHGAPDLVIGLRHALGVEILAHLAEDVVVAGPLKSGHHHRLAIGLRLRARKPELLGGPQAKKLVAARGRFESQLLVMRELLLETFLALVECGHARPLACERNADSQMRLAYRVTPVKATRCGRLCSDGIWNRALASRLCYLA